VTTGDQRLRHWQGARPDCGFVPETEGGYKDDAQGRWLTYTHIPDLFPRLIQS
jgi:hypothetical protein